MKNISKEISDFINIYKDLLLEKCENIIGIYLFGSLTYGGFDEKSSDIDLVVITEILLDKTGLENIKNIHKKLNEMNIKLAKRFEVSYTPISMLGKKPFQLYRVLITTKYFTMKRHMEMNGL